MSETARLDNTLLAPATFNLYQIGRFVVKENLDMLEIGSDTTYLDNEDLVLKTPQALLAKMAAKPPDYSSGDPQPIAHKQFHQTIDSKAKHYSQDRIELPPVAESFYSLGDSVNQCFPPARNAGSNASQG